MLPRACHKPMTAAAGRASKGAGTCPPWRGTPASRAGLAIAPIGGGKRLLAFLAVGCAACAAPSYGPHSVSTYVDRQVVVAGPQPGHEMPTPEIPSPAPSEPEQPATAETAAATRLTLTEAIAECLAADPRIRAGAQGLQQARADLWTASLVPNPAFGVSGSLLPLGQPFTVTQQGGPPQFDVGLAFPIDWLLFGKRTAAIDSARSGVDVATAELAELVRERLAATVAAFYDDVKAQGLLELARQDFASLERLQEITDELVRLGGAGTIEIDRVRVSRLDSQRQVRRREADLAIAKAALLAQIGRSADRSGVEVDGDLGVTSPPPPVSTDVALHIAEQYRPDVVAARLRVEQAGAESRQAQTEAFPYVVPHVGYTRQFQEHSIGFPDVNAFGVGVDMTLPVFDRNQGNIAKARSVVVQSESELRALLVTLHAEIEQATRDYRFAYDMVTTDTPLRIEAARNARDKIEAAFRAGGRPLIDVLDAQRTYRDTQRLDVEDRAGYWQSLYRLNAAVGKEVLR